MTYSIKRVVVIGSGTMGGGIAAHVANAGIPVYLLDIAPAELTPEEEKRGLKLDSPLVRNRIASASLERLKKSEPPAFFTAATSALVTIGNLEDNFDWIAEGDWIIEAIVEDLSAKRKLVAGIENVRKPDSIVSSNTSGLPIAAIAAQRSAEFKSHFIGTHFFNPPRYMKLLEVIPSGETLPEITSFIVEFAERRLGKGVVMCNDTPNFIANRLGSISSAIALNYVLENNYTVEEADAILGPLIGRPKTAIFRLQDLVGLDVSSSVAENLYRLIEHDERREVLRNEKLRKLRLNQIKRGRLGDKSGQGFYRKPAKGQKGEILTLDLETMEYRERREPRIPSIDEARKIESLPKRLQFLLHQNDKAGALARHAVFNSLAYAASCVPEITGDIINIDRAMRWGYSHEMGPFETWDALGVRNTVDVMEHSGIKVAPWVKEMLGAGHECFYSLDNERLSYYHPSKKIYVAERVNPRELKETVADMASDKQTVETLEARRTMSGIEYLSKMIAGEVPRTPMSQLINFRLVEVSEGRAVLTIEPDERYYNGLDIAHGGMAATVLDSALGCAVNTIMPAGKIFTTLEMKINYVRPIRRETGELRCEAHVIHAGSRVATAEGQIVDREGKTYAHGSATCMLFRAF